MGYDHFSNFLSLNSVAKKFEIQTSNFETMVCQVKFDFLDLNWKNNKIRIETGILRIPNFYSTGSDNELK